jgi:3-hydroxyisobutyrate dehydrogenase-like beta-hydroxyacid dehydrogenase
VTDIGIFGLGLMGSALAARLLAAGRPVVGHDPDPARQAALADLGGRPLSADGVWSAAGTVILSVFDTTQVEAVLSTAPDACRACVIIISTCDPDRIAALPGQCPPGLHLVEAPISGTSREVAAGGAVFLVGGDAEVVVLDREGAVLEMEDPLDRCALLPLPVGGGLESVGAVRRGGGEVQCRVGVDRDEPAPRLE